VRVSLKGRARGSIDRSGAGCRQPFGGPAPTTVCLWTAYPGDSFLKGVVIVFAAALYALGGRGREQASDDSSFNNHRMDRVGKGLDDVRTGRQGGIRGMAFDRKRTTSCCDPRPRPFRRRIGNEAVSGKAVAIHLPADDAALRSVMLGPQGMVQAMAPKSILIGNSHGGAEFQARSPPAAGARDVAYLARAVLGGKREIVNTGAL